MRMSATGALVGGNGIMSGLPVEMSLLCVALC